MSEKWVSTYQCQDCKRLVQVQYLCNERGHKARVLKSLDITEGNCRGCGEQLTENTLHYSGHRDLFERLLNRLDAIEAEISHIQGLKSVLSKIEDVIRTTKAWKDYEAAKYAEEQ